jgi:lipoprotein-anchoring transpeptidase ErfK/SrfK
MRRALFLAPLAFLVGATPLAAESQIDFLFKQRQQASQPAPAITGVDLGPVASIPAPVKSSKTGITPLKTIPRRIADDKLIKPAPAALAPETVAFFSSHAPGTLVIDTSRRALYRVLSGREAKRYVVAVGKEGFEWSGTETISARTKWPDWRPPAEMRQRDPSLPEFVPGGPRNPLGSRALYLGDTLYRIHGTWAVKQLGQNASSGCIRMHNAHVAELYGLVKVGQTKVVVTSRLPRATFAEGRGDTRPVRKEESLPMTIPAAFDPLMVPPSHPFGRR